MAQKEAVKINKSHGGKEFKSFFRFIGQVKPVRKKDQDSDSWEDQTIFEEKLTRTGKPRRVLQFNLETALSNELKVELDGMQPEFIYPYSSKHKNSIKVKYAIKDDKSKWVDENKKVKTVDETYHAIDTEWDKTLNLSQTFKVGDWVEVKGFYDPNEFQTDDGQLRTTVKRKITSIRPIVEGKLLEKDGEEPKLIKHGGEEFEYVTDVKAENFKEVNYFTMQVGIRSTYQDDTTRDTKVNGTYLMYGKERSEPRDVELVVYHKEAPEGKKSLADAFATLVKGDFIEVTGQDNNRATFAYVEVEEELANDDPFADVDESQKVTRKERVTSGDKKGLEITGYVTGSKVNGFLSEEEMKKTIEIVQESDPFGNDSGDNGLPWDTEEENPFA